MKILVLTSSFPRFKTDWWQQAVLSIYSNMDLRKYHVTVLAPGAPGAAAHEKIKGIDVRRFTYFYPSSLQLLTSGEGVLYTSKKNKILGKIQVITFVLAEFFATMSLLAKENFDIIHANWIIPQGLIAVFAKFIFRKPVVVTVHGTDIFAIKKLNFIKRFILKYSDLCTGNSSATYAEVLNIYPRANVKIVHMGVEVKMFDPGKREERWRRKFRENPKIILGVGRLIKWKGFEYLVRAMPLVLEKSPQAKLVIIGKGPEEENLKKTAQKIGLTLDQNIFFSGTFGPDKMPSIYASCDVVVSPSITIKETGEREGQGNVVLEARASGTPVIASRSGGLVDTVDGKTNGLLFKEKDYKGLARQVIKIFSDDRLRKKLSENGLRYVRENFSWRRTSSSFCRLYEEIVS